MDLEETEARNDCAGEASNNPTDQASQWLAVRALVRRPLAE
jgi:hypothetical protein